MEHKKRGGGWKKKKVSVLLHFLAKQWRSTPEKLCVYSSNARMS